MVTRPQDESGRLRGTAGCFCPHTLSGACYAISSPGPRSPWESGLPSRVSPALTMVTYKEHRRTFLKTTLRSQPCSFYGAPALSESCHPLRPAIHGGAHLAESLLPGLLGAPAMADTSPAPWWPQSLALPRLQTDPRHLNNDNNESLTMSL